MTEPLDLDALRRLAEAATPGPWSAHGIWLQSDPMSPGGEQVLARMWDSGGKRTRRWMDDDNAFIAATDPPTVLALLDTIAEYAKTVEYFDAQSKRRRDERDAARAEADELRRTLLDETYRAEGGEIVMRELRAAKRDRDAAQAELAALRAQVEASTARARDAITEDATS